MAGDTKQCRSGRHTYDAERRMCPDCQKERHAAWRARNRERVRGAAAQWRADNPETDREVQRAYRARNADRRHAYDKQWREANPERHAAKEHRRRALKRGASAEPYTAKEWGSVVAFYGGRCAYGCGRQWEHVDHVVPLSRGGAHALHNIVPACAECNLSKHVSTWSPTSRHPFMEGT